MEFFFIRYIRTRNELQKTKQLLAVAENKEIKKSQQLAILAQSKSSPKFSSNQLRNIFEATTANAASPELRSDHHRGAGRGRRISDYAPTIVLTELKPYVRYLRRNPNEKTEQLKNCSAIKDTVGNSHKCGSNNVDGEINTHE